MFVVVRFIEDDCDFRYDAVVGVFDYHDHAEKFVEDAPKTRSIVDGFVYKIESIK